MESSILWHLRHAKEKKYERINALVTLPLPKNAAHPTKTWAITSYLQSMDHPSNCSADRIFLVICVHLGATRSGQMRNSAAAARGSR
jgi:hypothetical protein